MIMIHTSDRKGLALIVVIIVIVIASIALLAIASGISNSAMLTTMRMSRDKALYAAEAGVYDVIRKYKEMRPTMERSSYMQLGTETRLDQRTSGSSNPLGLSYSYPGTYYKAFSPPDFLLIDASNPTTENHAGDSWVGNIFITNISGYYIMNGFYPIQKMKVEWTGMANTGVGYYWNGRFYWVNFSSGDFVNFGSNVTMRYGQKNVGFGMYFDNDVPSTATITVSFYFAASPEPRKFVIIRNGYSGNNEFQITSTGRVAAGPATFRRTIKATYDVKTDKVTSWVETDAHI
ncbi:MAG: hypothetical protein PHT32_06670 [Candidatus Omnitrophica bacterium]|nr:hypothetical protein [Candidatus Omnitrophota bacterium]